MTIAKHSLLRRPRVEATLGMQPRVWALTIVCWVSAMLQGISVALPAKGVEIILSAFSLKDFQWDTFVLYVAAQFSAPFANFLLQLVTLRAGVTHILSLHISLLKRISNRGLLPESEMDPDKMPIRLMNEGGEFTEAWRTVPNLLITTTTSFFVAFTTLNGMNVTIAVVIVVSLASSLLCSHLLSRFVARAWARNMDGMAGYQKTLKQWFTRGVNDVSYVQDSREWTDARINFFSELYKRSTYSFSFWSTLTNLAPAIISGLGPIVIVYLAFHDGVQLGVGDLVAILTFATSVSVPLSGLGMIFSDLAVRRVAAEKLYKLINVYEDMPSYRTLRSRLVRLMDVENVNDVISIRLVGASGSGKSRLIRNFALSEVKERSRRCAYVSQSPQFMDATIRENIAMGRNISNTDLSRLWSVFGLEDEFVDRLGIDTVIEGDCSNISGGQARRISLLRAIISKPDFLIIDEPFEGLNEELVSHIRNEVLDYLERCTIVEISHKEYLVSEDSCVGSIIIETGDYAN